VSSANGKKTVYSTVLTNAVSKGGSARRVKQHQF